jgi:hypothetical protein
MSKRARAFILGVTLAAMNLAGLTTVAHAQANDPTKATAVPALSWKDDYGTRHHVIPVQDGLGGWHDFLGTRTTPKPSMLGWKDDYGTRHQVIPVQDPMGGWHDFLGSPRTP